jgi:glycosyltransferase involved in cell wall biosynthesis
MNPKVSIIMPSLNVASYIDECIKSALSQTLEEIEIICVDAGSTDGTLEILKDFAERDNRIQLLYSNIKSYGYQVNIGLREAKGDYVAILETDDFVDKDMYEHLFQIAKSIDADFVRSYYYDYIYGKDYLRRYTDDIKVNTILVGNEIKKTVQLSWIWTALYKKEFLVNNNICFTETPGASYQDISFAFKVAICANRAFVTDKAFYHYRNDNPNSSVHSTKKVYCVCDEVNEARNFVDKHFAGQKEIYELLASFRFQTYLWNYHRLGYEDQLSFMNLMHNEMLIDWNSGNFRQDSFNPYHWSIVVDIIFNKEQFLWETSKLQSETLNKRLYRNAIMEELKKYSNIIIYGAGVYGKRMLSFLRNLRFNEEKIVFAVSKDITDIISNIPCRGIDSLVHLSGYSLVIIAVKGFAQQEMYVNAQKLGFKNILIMDSHFEKLIQPQV